MNDVAQTISVRQRKIKVLYQLFQFGGHFDFWRSDHDRAAVCGKLLADIAQAAHNDGVIHVAMKVFEYEDGLDRHRLHVSQSLHGFASVVDRSGSGSCAGFRSDGGHNRAGESLRFRRAWTQQRASLRLRADTLPA